MRVGAHTIQVHNATLVHDVHALVLAVQVQRRLIHGLDLLRRGRLAALVHPGLHEVQLAKELAQVLHVVRRDLGAERVRETRVILKEAHTCTFQFIKEKDKQIKKR